MVSYTRTRASKAFAQTNRFWNIHQAWSQLVPVLLGLVAALTKLFLKMEYMRLSNNNEALYAAAITAALYGLLTAGATYIVGWLGSFVWNFLFTAPGELHKEQQNTIKQQAAKIAEAERRPQRTKADEQRLAHIHGTISKRGPKAAAVLRHLQKHGKLSVGFYTPPAPSGMNHHEMVGSGALAWRWLFHCTGGGSGNCAAAGTINPSAPMRCKNSSCFPDASMSVHIS